jgi:hypothetical protein
MVAESSPTTALPPGPLIVTLVIQPPALSDVGLATLT